MRMLFALLVALLCSSVSYAAEYRWGHPSIGYSFGSPSSSCKALATYQGYTSVTIKGFVVQGAEASCTGTFERTPDAGGGTGDIYGLTSSRIGDSCNVDSLYNDKTGECVSQKKDGELCEDQQGHSVGNPMVWSKKLGQCVALAESDLDTTCSFFGGRGSTAYTVKGQMNSGGNAVAPPKFTNDMGCEVSTVETSECTLNVAGAISCNVTAIFTGNVGQSAGPDPRDAGCEGNKCVPVEPTTTVTDKPCVMSGNTCTAETQTESSGSQSCGSVNGNYICVTNKPASNGTKIETSVVSEVNADGSIKTVKKDDTTNTKCTDVKTCSQTTSTTTTTTTTNKGGQTTGTTVVCKGTCPDGSGKPGTGNGDGEGEEEGDGTANASDDCTVPPKCDGDVYLCSILRQEFINSCAERALPTDKQKAEFQAMMDKENAALSENQKSLDDKVTSMVSQFQSASSGSSSGGRCFEDKTFSVLGQSFSLPFSQVCGILEWFRYAILAIAYLISFRILTKDL